MDNFQRDIIGINDRIGRLVTGETEAGLLFNEINTLIKEAADAENAGLFLYDTNNRYLVLQEPFFNLAQKKGEKVYFSLKENNTIVNTYNTHIPFVCNEASSGVLKQTPISRFLKIYNIFMTPLLIGNRCIGVYCILNSPTGFTEKTETLINSIIVQTTILIENIQLKKQLEKRETEMKQAFQQEKENSIKYKYLTGVHQELTSLLLKESGLQGIVNRIAQSVKMPVLLFDYLHDERISSDIGRGKYDNFQLSVLVDYFKRLVINPEMYALKLFRESYANGSVDSTVIIAALKIRDDHFGFIVLFEDEGKVNWLQMMALELSVHTCAVEFLKQKMALEVDKNLKNDFWNELIYWDDNKETDIFNMAANLGYDFYRPYLIILLCLDKSDPLVEEHISVQKMKYLQRVLSEILKSIRGGISFSQKSGFILLIPGFQQNESHPVSKDPFFCRLHKTVLETLGKDFYIGVGSEVTMLREIEKSYQEACAAVDFLHNTGQKGIMFYNEMGFYKLFSDKQNRKHMEGIAHKYLEDIIKSDTTRGTSYLKTLEKYFSHDGNLRETADDLHIHLNTLRYRLKVLKDTFNIDISSEKSKFDAYFSINTLLFLCHELFE